MKLCSASKWKSTEPHVLTGKSYNSMVSTVTNLRAWFVPYNRQSGSISHNTVYKETVAQLGHIQIFHESPSVHVNIMSYIIYIYSWI